MRTVLAGLMLCLAAPAFAQTPCPKCLPGTTPLTYRVFVGGKLVAVCRQIPPGHVAAPDKFLWQGEECVVRHCGSFAPNPTGGLFCPPGVYVRYRESVGFLNTAEVKDGNGPFAVFM